MAVASWFNLSLRKGNLLERLMMLVPGRGRGGFGLRGRLLRIRLGVRHLLLGRRPGLDVLDLLAQRARP